MRRTRRTIRNRRKTRAARAYQRRYRMRSNPRRSRRRRYRRNGRPVSVRTIRRARRSLLNRPRSLGARNYARRYRMRSNPGGMFVDMIKSAIPVGLAIYAGTAVSTSLASRIPGLNLIPAKFQGTAMAALMGLAGHFATKKIAKLGKYRGPIMLGLGVNLLNNLVSALAPASLKSRIGLSGDLFADGLGDYVSVGGLGDYVSVGGAPPLDDQMTLADYVEVGAEEELGATVEEELGLEQELGGPEAYLGGVQQSSMLAPIPSVSPLQTIPARSFTKEVPRAGAGYDNPRNLYGGVFSGGFGG